MTEYFREADIPAGFTKGRARPARGGPVFLAVPLEGEAKVAAARTELEKSDIVAMRHVKAGVQYPRAWRERDEALRQIVRGEDVAWPAAPGESRKLINKKTVTDRLETIGKFATAFQALLANPTKFDAWYSPPHPCVYADDDGLLTFLRALGCSADQITFVTSDDPDALPPEALTGSEVNWLSRMAGWFKA